MLPTRGRKVPYRAEKTHGVDVDLPALQAVNDLGNDMLIVWVVEVRLQRHLAT